MKRTKCGKHRWFLSGKEMFFLKARMYQENYSFNINFIKWFL